MLRRLTNLTAGLASLAAIAALVGGVPWALVRFVGNPLPTTIPSWDRIASALTAGRVDPQVIISLLALVVWVTWAQLTLGLLVEALATMRGRPAPRLPITPGTQRLAAQLVTTASLLLSTLGPARPALAVDLAVLHTPAAVTAAADPAQPEPAPAQLAEAPAASAAEAAPLYVVQRGDTLWDIAERTLGDGAQWTRIRDLNVGRLQPDGTRLPADLVEGLRAGWTLALPQDAAPPAAPSASHVVVPGESLSDIADDAYGDPSLYPQIFDANVGRPQPDGRALTDPDVLQPGWQLNLPPAGDSTGITAPAAAALPAAPTTEPVPAGDSTGITAPAAAALPAAPTTEPAPEPGDPAAGEPDDLLPDEQSANERLAAAPPTPRSSPAATPQGTAMPATTTTALADRAEDGARVVAPAAIGASALVAGSLLWTLTRLRARQARRRRPGRDNPLPGPDLVKVERALRGEAAEQPVAWVDATLRLLTVRLRARPAGAQPVALLALYVTEETVELLLGQPDGEPPTGFLASDDGYTWRLDPELALQAVQAEADGATPLAPATVTLGSTDQGLLLVNLEQLALLRIQGPAEVAQPFLSGLAVELATAPWAASVTLHPVVDDDDPIARLPRARPVAALHDIAGGLQTQADATRNAIGAEATTAAARTAPDGEDWPPTVVILRRSPAGAQALQALSKAAQQPGSGLALTVVGDVDDATWRLQLRDDGTASLEPLGLEIMLSGLDDADAAAAADLLAVASEEDIARPTRIHAQHSEPAADRERSDDGAAAVPVSLGPLPVEITVLGPVSVTGWEAREVRPQFAEIVTYLAMHDRPVPTDALRTALWPEGIHYNTFKNVVSRTRQALGSDGEGNYHLPEARDGRYRVGPEVGCDWNRFQGLVRAARIAAPRQSVALLRSALELIEGRPFQGSPAGTYQWAFDEQFVSAIEVAAVDAAHRLAELALDADDPDTAIWATRRGHLVVPDHEGLYRTRMRAYARRGDVDGVEQTFREALRAARAYDALDDVQPETRQLYDELVRPQRASRGA